MAKAIPATILRGERKNLEIRVGSDERVVVRAPHGTSEKFIQQVLMKKLLWIKEKQHLVRIEKAKYRPKKFVEGEGFLYLGRFYKLHLHDSLEVPLVFRHNSFSMLRNVDDNAGKLFLDWYIARAERKIGERAKLQAKRIGLQFNSLSITKAEKRWGSCNPQAKTLNFTWRLVMAPIEVIDYIVVHELCHLEHANHSTDFWAKVESIVPDYWVAEKWLDENQTRMVL